jgi:hypothetical protein
VHCGLGIGLAAGKCSAERISEQGSDVRQKRIGDAIAEKSVARLEKNGHAQSGCTQDKKSLRKHHPFRADL